MAVEEISQKVQQGVSDVQKSKEHLAVGNEKVEEVGAFLARMFGRMHSIQNEIVRFMTEKEVEAAVPGFLKASQLMEPVIADTLPALSATKNGEVQELLRNTKELHGSIGDYGSSANEVVLALGELFNQLTPIIEETKGAAETSSALVERGKTLMERQNAVIAGLEAYTV